MNKQALLKRIENLEAKLDGLNTETLEEILSKWFEILEAILLDDELAETVFSLSNGFDFKRFRDDRAYRQQIKAIVSGGDCDDG